MSRIPINLDARWDHTISKKIQHAYVQDFKEWILSEGFH